MRILIVKDSPSCRLTITSNAATDNLDWIEVIEGNQGDIDQCDPASWDLMITHIHEADAEGDCSDVSLSEKGSAEDASGPVAMFRKLFRRKKPSEFDLEERRATSFFLAEIQRDLGVALSAIEMGDFDTVGEIAVRLKHDGAIYHFEKISGLGAALLDTVFTRDARTARNIAEKLMEHLGRTIGDYTD